jgi:hypothetical protein
VGIVSERNSGRGALPLPPRRTAEPTCERFGARHPNNRPAVDEDSFHQRGPAHRRELSPSMSQESLLSVGVATPTVREALAKSTTSVGTTAHARTPPHDACLLTVVSPVW